MTAAAARKLALALPETAEHPYHQHSAFKLGKKHFATLLAGGAAIILRLTFEQQDTLVAAEPETFALTAWGRNGWTSVTLANVEVSLFRELLEDAWRGVAPKKLAATRASAR